MKRRAFIIVLDSAGIGELPDAEKWGDKGSNTLASIRNNKNFSCENLERLGLFSIEGVGGAKYAPVSCFARMAEASQGKDTTIGHWEIAGVYSANPLPTYLGGFPKEIIEEFEKRTGRKTLCNLPYSGTDVIRDFGKEHVESGALIVYTSADSVFQIAAHEAVVPVEELYRYCQIARDLLQGEHGVGRVIARPFEGEYPYKRTPRRHDFSLTPPAETVADRIKAAGLESISVGKIYDIFAGRGFTESLPTVSNEDGMDKALMLMERDFSGFAFINLVEFDMTFGHRNDIDGYAAAMTAFDKRLGELLPLLREEDLLIITADHGCDPATPSTDHSREYTPMLAVGKRLRRGVDLGTRGCFGDIGCTCLEWLGLPTEGIFGKSFLQEIIDD